MFDSIINLFGNDIAKNFIIMMTFCDNKDPQLKSALLSPESNLKEIISLIKYPWYLKLIILQYLLLIKINLMKFFGNWE